MTHIFPIRVYYEDTDLAGIVYYANYLKFIERARSEWVRSLGIDQNQLHEEDDVVFAVRRVEADYLQPAHFDDELTVETSLEGNTAAHVKASMMGSSVQVLIKNGKICLGTWQGIYFCEFDGPRSRKVWMSLLQSESN